jgi:hypothetical protein
MATPKSTDKHCARKTTVQKGVDDKMARTRGRDRILSRRQSQSCLINRTRDLLSVIYSFFMVGNIFDNRYEASKDAPTTIVFFNDNKNRSALLHDW